MTTSAFIKSQSDAQLLDFVKKGRPVSDPANTTKVDMPPKGGNPALTDAQLLDIIAYIRSVQR
jgi:disulfide bond formation protein DsbB